MRLNDADNRTAAHALDEVHPEWDARNFRSARDLRNFGFPVFKLGAFAGRAGGLAMPFNIAPEPHAVPGALILTTPKKGNSSGHSAVRSSFGPR